jgi:hypothetical protein
MSVVSERNLLDVTYHQKLGGNKPTGGGMCPCFKIFCKKASSRDTGPLETDGVTCKHNNLLQFNVISMQKLCVVFTAIC